MKNVLAMVMILAGIVLSGPKVSQAQDGFFSDAVTLGDRHFGLGIQPVIYTMPNRFMMLFRGGYGAKPDLSIYGKLGLFDKRGTYIGVHLKYMLMGEPEDPLSFSVIGGVYSFKDLGLKFAGVVSKNLGTFSLYSGMSYEPLFAGKDVVNALMLPIGAEIPFNPEAAFILEGDIPLNNDGDPYQAITFGIDLYL